MKHFLMCLLYIAALGVLSFVVGRLIPKHWFHADRFPWVCTRQSKNYGSGFMFGNGRQRSPI